MIDLKGVLYAYQMTVIPNSPCPILCALALCMNTIIQIKKHKQLGEKQSTSLNKKHKIDLLPNIWIIILNNKK